ncbi:arsenic resistance protein [Cellulomonas triticagri]|uniref:Arsenic resistance protein n=1 Tax=Cellulomonas triticagri TaxID=2483352 RepID=A0A3M2J2K1_9CELL|nr:arsenic resistance protein [Cellulomonas triticagri]RMI07044.1 arsenic resistance protein [Cellulomonas triticagri]
MARARAEDARGWAERHQVGLYLAAIGLGALVGVLVPGAAAAEVAITPVLGVLLYATFLGVPFAAVGRALRDGRFLGAVLALNFVVVPVVVWLLSRPVAGDDAVLLGVLLVLLTPCVDYVVVFTGLAGGAADRLLAAAPVLMVAQLVLLPGYLLLMAGPEAVAVVEVGPFVEAFVVLIAVPLAAAAATQALARRSRVAARVQAGVLALMVPLMVATLGVVVASQAAGVGAHLGRLAPVVPVLAGFALVMALVGAGAGRVLPLDVPARRALLMSGVTRNSLVVLPLALALPAGAALAPVVVVTQTLVELVVMVLAVRLVPRLVPARAATTDRPTASPPGAS